MIGTIGAQWWMQYIQSCLITNASFLLRRNQPGNVSVLEDNRDFCPGWLKKKNKSSCWWLTLTLPHPPGSEASNICEHRLRWGSCLIRLAENTAFTACSLPFCQSYATAAWSCKFSSFLVISVCRLLKAISVGSGTIGQPWWKLTGHIFTSISTVYTVLAYLWCFGQDPTLSLCTYKVVLKKLNNIK